MKINIFGCLISNFWCSHFGAWTWTQKCTLPSLKICQFFRVLNCLLITLFRTRSVHYCITVGCRYQSCKTDYSQFCNKYIIGNNTHAGEAAVDRAYKDGQNPSVKRYHPKWCKIKPFNYSNHQTHNTTSHTPHTSQHCTPPSNAPTPTQLDHRQSLTPSNALQLGSFLWLTVKLSGFKSFFRTILVFKITQISRKLIGGIIYQL